MEEKVAPLFQNRISQKTDNLPVFNFLFYFGV